MGIRRGYAKEKSKYRDFAERVFRVVFGLFIFAAGNYLTILGNIGLTPWDSVHMGITNIFSSLSFGTIHIIVSVVVLIADLLMKEKIGLGTIFDAVLVGPFVDMWTAINPIKSINNFWLGTLVAVVGLFIMAVGQYFYMSGGLSCGPRDSLLVGVGKRFPKIKIGFVDIGMKIILVIIALALKGPIGLGTLIAMCGMGLAMQIVFTIFRFDPRIINQLDLIQTYKSLLRN